MTITIISSLISGIIGVAIASYINYRIYKKQILRSHYSEIALRIQRALTLSSIMNNPNTTDPDKSNAKLEIDSLFNQIWALSLIGLPDRIFKKFDDLFSTPQILLKPQNMNEFYYELRKSLNKGTTIELNKILDRFISTSPAPQPVSENQKDEKDDKDNK